MFRLPTALLMVLCLAGWGLAQVDQLPPSDRGPGQSQAPPRSDRDSEAGVSSSRETKIDISPPKDDAKDHPNGNTVEEAEPSDVQEMHPWNPHKAAKDIEVGDFYFRRKNYAGALSRYQEALLYKPGDAIANFRLGECYTKMEKPAEAVAHYKEYLKILPQGPLAGDAHKALQKLQAAKEPAAESAPAKP
jgi:tetratricopeptide (TPR) repeat protein